MEKEKIVNYVNLENLIEDPSNPNVMKEERFELLVQGIRTGGFLQPLLVSPTGEKNKYFIVDGHHRYKAAKIIGMDRLPCVITKLNDQDRNALQLAMNRLRGEIDLSKARVIVQELVTDHGWDLDKLTYTGFTTSELNDLLASRNDTVEEILKEASEAVVSLPDEKPEPNYVLDIPFPNKEQFILARKALKRAAGKGKELFEGLLNLIGENSSDDPE